MTEQLNPLCDASFRSNEGNILTDKKDANDNEVFLIKNKRFLDVVKK